MVSPFGRAWTWHSEYSLVVSIDGRIAFAARRFQLLCVCYEYAPTSVMNQSLRLQLTRLQRNACTAHAHHLTQKLLGKRQLWSDQIVDPGKPAAHTRLHGVCRVAAHRLLHLSDEELLVFREHDA